jgi:hypothetical protein
LWRWHRTPIRAAKPLYGLPKGSAGALLA